MESYEIRKTETHHESKAVEDLFRKIFVLEKSVFSETSLPDFSQNYECLAVFYESRIVAASFFAIDSDSMSAEIVCLAVAAEFRRQNIGKRLLNEILQTLGKKGVKTATMKALIGSRPFLLAHGFIETHKPEISGNNAFLRMHKELE